MKSQKKKEPEIKPLPHQVPIEPKKNPEITPNPERNEPYHPLPEIKPNSNPEIIPEKI